MKKRNILLMLLVLVIMASCWGLKTEAATSFIYDKDYIHDGTEGVSYEAAIYYYGYGDKIKSAAVSSGTLPPGLSYHSAGYDSGHSRVTISGTPTKAGTYSFKITAITVQGKTLTSSWYTVIISPYGQTYKLTLTGCVATDPDWGGEFTECRAGSAVKLVPNNLASTEYVVSWKNDAGLDIPVGNDYFTMPARNVSIQCVKKTKDLGTLQHNAASSQKSDYVCSRNAIDSILRNGYYSHDAEPYRSETQSGTFLYYYIDLDKDGTLDLEVRDYENNLSRSDSGMEYMIKAMPGRSVYGTWTFNVNKDDYWYYYHTNLYSKIVLNMGSKNSDCPKSSSGHKIQGIQAKAPTCTKDGYRWHWECTECGEWFADAEGKTKVTNKSLYTLKAMGHKWSAWYVAKEATETEEGIRERVCYNNRNHKEQETIPKLPPAPTEPPTTEAPTTEAPTEPPTTEAPTTEAPTEPPTTEAPTTEAPTEPPTTEAPTTEAPTEPPTTEATTTEAPTEPETTEAPTAEAPTEPETTAAPTEAPTQAPTEAPKPTDPETPAKSGGGNTILYVLLGVMAVVSGLLGGILIGKRSKEKNSK